MDKTESMFKKNKLDRYCQCIMTKIKQASSKLDNIICNWNENTTNLQNYSLLDRLTFSSHGTIAVRNLYFDFCICEKQLVRRAEMQPRAEMELFSYQTSNRGSVQRPNIRICKRLQNTKIPLLKKISLFNDKKKLDKKKQILLINKEFY